MSISVIVVTYNQEDTIGATLDSILAQQIDEKVEIVIGDDCSADNTETVCRRYAATYPDRIVYLRRKQNMGVTANYFDCIAHASGDYLADCAGDDVWVDPYKLARQRDVLDKRPEVSLVATDWLCRDLASGALSRSPRNKEVIRTLEFAPGELLVPILTNEITIHLCSAMFRKKIIAEAVEKNPRIFTDPHFSCEDQQILLTLAKAGKIVILPGVSLHYTVGHDSISHPADFARKFEYSLRALRQTLILRHHFELEAEPVRRLERRSLNHLAAMALRAGREANVSRADGRPARLRRFIYRRNLSTPLKARIYLNLMKAPRLWKFINRFRS
ncbi:MAG: glycosyltransferase [Bacteroidales bacterium]|nr:glycosyltransferase [Bacteroidales bacterium]MBD5223260.1 glycosyltransferase [Bacteroidales bacterium]